MNLKSFNFSVLAQEEKEKEKLIENCVIPIRINRGMDTNNSDLLFDNHAWNLKSLAFRFLSIYKEVSHTYNLDEKAGPLKILSNGKIKMNNSDHYEKTM